MAEPTTTHYPDDEIDLRELFATLWRGKWIIILFTIVFAAAGVFYALNQPNIYQASALLAPAQNEGGSRISGQLSGLASLAGVNLGGGGGANKTVLAKETLKSRAFLTDFIRRHDLAVPLMAAKAWNMTSERWILDQDVYNPENGEWQIDEDGESLKPTDWDLVKEFRGLLGVSDNKDTGMVTVSIKSLSPVAARDWVEKLVQDINEHMRTQDVQEAEASIAYLEDKLRQTNIAGMQQVFYQLIEQETRTVMLANAQREYVFKTVDPAVAPQEKSEPKRALIAIVATMLGGMLGIFTVFLIAFIRSGKVEPEQATKGV
ncbi:Wzz/FepE/Etk N-terminal domain-containing protein [Marinobacter halophilus]|uniref:LPS O-antigen length regulator n=1 Tax=Marinobacter halophilus TaxID=1323740 RepID=A0A2T1KCB3_9GAMM|nr:Wzz/FepE/Etk N-terminal domain-containing protein [Marinobacter halophilus]PSF07771.1 LPS O-antigen length regulator [Marinobacter halophilus]GGC56923.1 LPS biosynthesis protein [Marinobacter halophilus]